MVLLQLPVTPFHPPPPSEPGKLHLDYKTHPYFPPKWGGASYSPKNTVSDFFGAAAESAVCLSLGQAYITLLIIFSLRVIMDFPSNYKCRASICSLFSQVTLGALLLGFLCFMLPILFSTGIFNCGLSNTVAFQQ